MAEVLAYVFAALCFAVSTVSAYRQKAVPGPHRSIETIQYALAGLASAAIAALSWLDG